VFQLAAHEQVLAVKDLYALCAKARKLLSGEHGVGRVIARPFTGPGPGQFVRLSSQRRDYPLQAPRLTARDHLREAGVRTRAIGKINDIFGGRGISAYERTSSNANGIKAISRSLIEQGSPSYSLTSSISTPYTVIATTMQPVTRRRWRSWLTPFRFGRQRYLMTACAC
jgi:phosphopentomutase